MLNVNLVSSSSIEGDTESRKHIDLKTQDLRFYDNDFLYLISIFLICFRRCDLDLAVQITPPKESWRMGGEDCGGGHGDLGEEGQKRG